MRLDGTEPGGPCQSKAAEIRCVASGPATKKPAIAASSGAARSARRSRTAISGCGNETRSAATCRLWRSTCSFHSACETGSFEPTARLSSSAEAGRCPPANERSSLTSASRCVGGAQRATCHRLARKAAATARTPAIRPYHGRCVHRPNQDRARKARMMPSGSQSRGQSRSQPSETREASARRRSRCRMPSIVSGAFRRSASLMPSLRAAPISV